MQPINQSVSSYGTFGEAVEPNRGGKKLNIEFNDTSKYANELEKKTNRVNRESSSYHAREGNYESNYNVKQQPNVPTKLEKMRDRANGRRHSHPSKHKYRKHQRQEQALVGENYSVMETAIPVSSTPRGAKLIKAVAPQRTPSQTSLPAQRTLSETSTLLEDTEENIDEKKKSKDEILKSRSMEQMQRKESEVIAKTTSREDLLSIKNKQINENDQQMLLKRKIIQFVEQIAKVGIEGLKDEFIQCRPFIPNAVTRIAHDQNLLRCRYPDVICIDQTRVVLKCDNGDSDFIHANRVPLGDNLNEIIITQLPLSNTVKHFWEMVWQENVQTILLFLTLNEWKHHAENIQLIPGKGKCLHIEDVLMLTHKNEVTITPDWLVREYYLSKSNETRRILWYHYSAWEPNRSPKHYGQLWPLHSSLRKVRRPYVCMSLAGAGRAGCYAALEWAHLMLHDRTIPKINIAECVRKVRTYRMHAVQTIAQFQFLYIGIQHHIFYTEKFRKEILSEQAMLDAIKTCSLIEYNFFRSADYPADDDFQL